jgi:3-hydroxyisobutyrate dehydrogenase-like beta-hydroxyacid dehydrogenase
VGVVQTGFIGLGEMGRSIAINQVRAGFSVTVYDKRQEPLDDLAAIGARIARSPREVAAASDVIGLSLRDDDQLEAVVLGAGGVLSGARSGSVLTVHTTCHPDTVRRIALDAAAQNVAVIDAPMSNGATGAARAALCFMVGGEIDALERARPVLEASGKEIVHMGPLGAGLLAKLAHQVICLGTVTAVAEGMLLAEKAGLALPAFSNLLQRCSAQSHFADVWLSTIKDMQPNAVAVMCESVDPARKLAAELGLTLPLAALAQQVMPTRVPVSNGG